MWRACATVLVAVVGMTGSMLAVALTTAHALHII